VNAPELIPKLFMLLNHGKKTIRREVCWVISNLTSGGPGQIEIVLREPENMKKLINVAQNDIDEVLILYYL